MFVFLIAVFIIAFWVLDYALEAPRSPETYPERGPLADDAQQFASRNA